MAIFGAGNAVDIANIIEKVKDKGNKEFYIWLDKAGTDSPVEKFRLDALQKNNNVNLRSIDFDNKPNGYDINDLLRDEQESFAKAVQSYMARATSWLDLHKQELKSKAKEARLTEVEKIPVADMLAEYGGDKAANDFYKALDFPAKTVLFLSGATGIGKTHHVISVMIKNLHKEESSTLFCSSLHEVDRAIGIPFKEQIIYYGNKFNNWGYLENS